MNIFFNCVYFQWKCFRYEGLESFQVAVYAFMGPLRQLREACSFDQDSNQDQFSYDYRKKALRIVLNGIVLYVAFALILSSVTVGLDENQVGINGTNATTLDCNNLCNVTQVSFQCTDAVLKIIYDDLILWTHVNWGTFSGSCLCAMVLCLRLKNKVFMASYFFQNQKWR